MDQCKIVFLFLFASICTLSYSASEIQPIYEFNIPTRDVGFTPDGKNAIVAGANGINFYDLETGELKRQLKSDDH